MNIGDEINVSKRTGIFLQLKCFENFHLNWMSCQVIWIIYMSLYMHKLNDFE
jgi:hypothetical protein